VGDTTLLRRRAWCGLAWLPAMALLGPALAGCGFELRRPAELPYTRIALTGFAKGSAMAEALRLALPASARIVEAPKDAEVVLAALDDHLYRIVAASTSAGQVREFRLRVLLKFRLTRPDGKMLLADTELEQSRDLSYSETAALAKQAEEAALLREMRADLAQQVLRMLAAAGRSAATAEN
jgi:LPS-assembly lipoprotein